ncbi:hypothetical protein [Collimonas arenae]|uniref:hypothetical protein n=1 Tax=Collimonas arenae TaxID=279058 RepID=UPI0012E0BEEC|nr:hypothetical protein [Collimonas arenae]
MKKSNAKTERDSGTRNEQRPKALMRIWIKTITRHNSAELFQLDEMKLPAH